MPQANNFTILYDEPQEAAWFRSLHSDFRNAAGEPITKLESRPSVAKVLSYDRPDIVLLDKDTPILVVEETVEVPSGHNVGQRFARIAAAAECRVPCLYFGPYVARKHGGITAGPRYMNLRLFHAIDAMTRATKTSITTINWPVDDKCEVRRDKEKDQDVREYVSTFLAAYREHGVPSANSAILRSEIHKRMLSEREDFISKCIRNPEQYDGPPDSVELLPLAEFKRRHGRTFNHPLPGVTEVIVYNVGMTYIRSDPYTGMAMLYRYLYLCEHPHRALVLWFPNITVGTWKAAAKKDSRKDIRLFKHAGDAILFSDGLLPRTDL